MAVPVAESDEYFYCEIIGERGYDFTHIPIIGLYKKEYMEGDVFRIIDDNNCINPDTHRIESYSDYYLLGDYYNITIGTVMKEEWIEYVHSYYDSKIAHNIIKEWA